MKYVVETIKYGFKNSIRISVFVLLPALFMGYFVTPFCLTNFLSAYPNHAVHSYLSVFNKFFDFSWQNVLLTTIGLVLTVSIITLLFGLIEKHMRAGKFTIEDGTQIFNSNVIVTALYSLLIVVLYIVFMIVLSLILFGLHVFISGIGNAPTTLNVVVTYSVSIFALLLFFKGLMYLYYAIPETISTGYSLSTCVSEINSKLGKNSGSAYFAFILPLVLHFPIMILSVGHWWYVFVLFVLMFVYVIYYTSLVYVVYFDVSNFARKDIDTSKLIFRR